MMKTALSKADSFQRCQKLIKILEVVVLSSIIFVVWSIFVVIPIVIYALPSVKVHSSQSGSGQNEDTSVKNSLECSEQTNYEGSICSEELRQWQQCFSGVQTNDVLLPSNVDQQKAEDSASLLLSGLQFLSPSQVCVAAIKPFMCLYLFGSCDYQNQFRQVSRADCLELRDELCPHQWKTATKILGEGTLPDCSLIEEHEIQCLETNVTLFNETNRTSENTFSSPQNLTCAQGFYAHNESTCRHLCNSWVNSDKIDADGTVVVLSLVVCLLSSIIGTTVMLTVMRSEMLTFPKVYLIFLCVSTAVVVFITLIGYFDKKLFCSSIDLIESIETESAYCTINGIVYNYGVIQIGLWCLFFTLGTGWGILFPFHYREFKSTQRLKYIHPVIIILSFVLPIIPISIQLKDGYHMTQIPKISVCIGRNIDAIFYAYLFPFSILSALITTLLVLIFWKILKVLTFNKLSSERSSGKAEAKILLITFNYVLTSCALIGISIHSLVTSDKTREIITSYLLCQTTGLQPDKQCESPDMQLAVLKSLNTTSVVFQCYIPVVVLLFTAKCTCPRLSKIWSGHSLSTRSSN